jgi:Uncharacterized conserved protein
MCGRYSLFTPFDDLEERFDVAIETYEPRYNAAPGQSLPVIPDRNETTVTRMEWGLVPSWADERDGHINARARQSTRSRRSARRSRGARANSRPAGVWFRQTGSTSGSTKAGPVSRTGSG